jgi:hypothetical protein
MTTQLDGNATKHAGNESITGGGICTELLSVASVEVYSITEQRRWRKKIHTFQAQEPGLWSQSRNQKEFWLELESESAKMYQL